MKKLIAMLLVLAMMLVFGCAMGGTLAYLMTSSGPVTNTFTVGDINIELWEHDLDDTTGATTAATIPSNDEDYKVLPGTEQNKDPFVTVKAKSEDCWVFVKIVEKNNYLFTEDEDGNKTYTTTPYIQWAIDSGWTEVSKTTAGAETTYVYGRSQSAVTADTDINILKDKLVKYDQNLTKAQLNALGQTKPVLEFTAYAVQKEAGTTAQAAWTASGFAGTSQG